jgi:hypothetical protein
MAGELISVVQVLYNKKPSFVNGLASDGGALVLVVAVIYFMILR